MALHRLLCRLSLHVWGEEDYDGWTRDAQYGETCAVCSKERTVPARPRVESKYEPSPVDREMLAQMTQQVQEMYGPNPGPWTYTAPKEKQP